METFRLYISRIKDTIKDDYEDLFDSEEDPSLWFSKVERKLSYILRVKYDITITRTFTDAVTCKSGNDKLFAKFILKYGHCIQRNTYQFAK